MPRAGESIEEWMGALEKTPDTKQKENGKEELRDAPPYWNGPFPLTYLWKHAGPGGKAMRFKDFDEAIKAAMTIDECCGITKTSQSYELRRGINGLTPANPMKHSSALCSWVKNT